jgi:hypothetical protein
VGAGGELDADEEPRNGDGGDRHLVVVSDYLVELYPRAVSVDEESRVEKKPAQRRVSIFNSSRSEAMSWANPRSLRWRRSMVLTSAPLPGLTGSSWANDRASPDDREVFVTMLHRVEDVGEVPGGVRCTHFRHQIRYELRSLRRRARRPLSRAVAVHPCSTIQRGSCPLLPRQRWRARMATDSGPI